MSCYSKEKMERNDYNNICKSHSARSDRAELYRICPSKLSKRELEDLYFSLLENNLELKRTINGQQDKIKGFSAKVQRMSAAQKTLQSKEMKECCIGTKSIVTEQKESITELKRTNQRLAEKVRQLNMRLCSAKQFYKRSPPISSSRCPRCELNTATTANTSTTPKKHNCVDKPNEPVLKLSTSCQYVDRDTSVKSAQTETRELEKSNADLPCDENKCRTVMEELTQKILNLQEELSHVHDEYSSRISRLESEVCEVRKENLRVCAERAASQHELTITSQRTSELLTNCRNAEGKCAELSTQLSIERRKVAELETRLKAANISDRVNKTIEDHLTNINETNVPTHEINVTTHKSKIPTRKTNGGPTQKTKVPPQNSNVASAENTSPPNNVLHEDTLVTSNASTKSVCACQGVTTDKTPTKDMKIANCACPPHLESLVYGQKTETAKTSKTTSIKSALSKVFSIHTAPTTDAQNVKCGCPAPQTIETVEQTSSVICACHSVEKTTPGKNPKNVICGCPPWQDSELIKSTPTKDTNCVNCACLAEKASESFQATPTKDADMSWSPKIYHDEGHVFRTPDDSGYLDTRSHDTSEEVGLSKVNKELMKRIVELQNQVDSMKIAGATELPKARPRKHSHTAGNNSCGETPRNSVVENSGHQIDNHHQYINENETPTAENHEPEKLEKPAIPSDKHKISDKPKTRTPVDHGPKKPEIASGNQMPSKPEDQQHHKSLSNTKRKLELMPDQITKAPEDTVGQLNITIPEERKMSKSEIIFGSPNSVNDDKLHPDAVQNVPGQPQISPTEERKSEFGCNSAVLETNGYREPNKAEIVPENLKMKMPEEHKPSNPELKFGIRKLPSKGELVSGKPEMHGSDSMPSTSKFGYIIPSTPPHEYRDPKKTEAVPGKLQITETQGMIDPDLLYAGLESATKDFQGPEKTELVSGQSPNDVNIMPRVTNNIAPEMTELEKNIDEGCQHCPACSYETECALHLTVGSKIELKSNGFGARTGQVIKNDQHNSLQIPGPIPSGDNDNDWKKNVFKNLALEKKKLMEKQKHKDKPKLKRESVNGEPPKRNETADTMILPDVPILYRDRKSATNEPVELQDVSRDNYYTLSKDSIAMTHRRSITDQSTVTRESHGTPLANVSLQNFYIHSDDLIRTASRIHQNGREQSTQVQQKTEQKSQDQMAQTVPTKDSKEVSSRRQSKVRKRDVSVYRRHSGTLCFRTLPIDDDSPRICQCKEQVGGKCAGKPRHKGIQVQGQEEASANQQRKFSTAEQGTYTVDSKQSRSTSPDDNTEYEMSYLSDLPLEKDAKLPFRNQTLSPGEEKTATTQTETSTSPVTTNYSLSEGELPPTYTRRISHDAQVQQNNTATQATEPSQKMEAALQAITDELVLCKTLLSTQRPTEVLPHRISSPSQISLSESERNIPLHRGIATQSIGDAYAPKCIFTLHIGTVVLSDEAVLNSRNKTLVLTWKFYDQNIAMTRMRAGRVVLFDFSTEYDVKITDDFLHYMKFEEMPIVICELDKQDEPFASCTLPLRDALLHTNRRADMSLALVAGPQMISAREAAGAAAADALDAGDEMGVIDLWCMLRADTKMLPEINRAIAQASRPRAKPSQAARSSRVLQQIPDDERSNECEDLDLTLQQGNAAHLPPSAMPENKQNVYRDVEFKRTSRRWDDAFKVAPQVKGTNTQTTTQDIPDLAYDPSMYPPVRPRRNSSEALRPMPPPIFHEDPTRESSTIIINEVEAKIKSPGDMKQALEKSCQKSELMARLAKADEDVGSQAQSSIGSLKSLYARLQRRGSPRSFHLKTDVPQSSMLLQNMRRGSMMQDVQTKIKDRDELNDMETYRKYENIAKLIGPNRGEASKKSVTILPNYLQEDEEPQRDLDQQLPKDIQDNNDQCLHITVLWLALNEECEAMVDPHVQRVYVAYTFLGRNGAELETPVSLPKPKHYVDKCYFNFRKTFDLEDSDLPMLGHMARCRASSKVSEDEKDCIIFSVVSEPPEDPLGLESCEDIGYAYLYLGDLLAYSAGSSSYTEVIPVRAARGQAAVCGVLAVCLDGLDVVRRCLQLSSSQRDFAEWTMN